MESEEDHEGYEGGDRDGGRGEEVCEGGLPALLGHRGAVASVVVLRRRKSEHGDDLRDAREYARYALSCHDRLGVFGHPEPGHICKDAILTESRGGAGGEDDGHEEAEVDARRYTSEEHGREGEEGKADDVEEEGEDDAVRVVGAFLKFGQEEHDDEACHGGDGGQSRREGGEEGVGGAETVLEVGRRGEEHVPAWLWSDYTTGALEGNKQAIEVDVPCP